MPQKITKRTVDSLSPASRDVLVWDGEVKGFGIRCRSSGAKYYVLKMRAGGRQRWITIGRHGSPWTPDTARREALRLLGLRAAGKDPATERDRLKGAVTIAEFGDRFLQDHVEQHCKPRLPRNIGGLSNSLSIPSLGATASLTLIRADVAQLHHQLRDRPYQANRSLAVLSKMMNLAEAWGLRLDGSNPCRHVKKYREDKRERYLTMEELQRLGATLADAKRNDTETPVRTCRYCPVDPNRRPLK